ncbi:MAG TPA: RNA methyltransferase [Candidatus Dojkabacteria bacterium]|nr:RNA methyltransferase [Candidatus Dojkabacteria bacterium]
MKKLYIIIDNVRSAYNVGSIFRTADGAGAYEILICGISPTPEHLKVKKTALGSTESIKWRYFKTTEEAITSLKEQNVPVYGVEITDDAVNYLQVQYPNEVALVLGHETEGIKRHILQMCDKVIYVPMFGKKESLNVATIAGIVVYEVMRDKILNSDSKGNVQSN